MTPYVLMEINSTYQLSDYGSALWKLLVAASIPNMKNRKNFSSVGTETLICNQRTPLGLTHGFVE